MICHSHIGRRESTHLIYYTRKISLCKYRNEKIGVDELDLIRDYASVFGKGNNYHYYIFSKGGFTDGLLQAQQRGEVRQELTLAVREIVV
jgi:hypothetical protein